MKKIIGVLFLTILLQSCMTYKGVKFEDIDINKTNHLQINLKGKSDKINGLLISKNQNEMTIETYEEYKPQKRDKKQTISKNDIVKMWKVKGYCFIGCLKVYN